MKELMTSISVHGPEVVKLRTLPGLDVSSIELGRKDTEVTTVSLFVDDDALVGFVGDLVRAVEGAHPGFLGDLLDRITVAGTDCCASCDGHACD